jgi:hypothetical protein
MAFHNHYAEQLSVLCCACLPLPSYGFTLLRLELLGWIVTAGTKALAFETLCCQIAVVRGG